MKAFHEISACDLKPRTLQDEMSSRGYVLIRDLLPRGEVHSVLSDTTRVLSAAGWLSPDSDPRERVAAPGAACGDPDPAFKRVCSSGVFNLESFPRAAAPTGPSRGHEDACRRPTLHTPKADWSPDLS